MKKKNFILNALLLVLAISFTACEPNEEATTETQPEAEVFTQVVGEWQMYRDENMQPTLDQWTGTEWTTIDTWYKNVREDSEIILEFSADGTFVDRYADVEVFSGTWVAIENNTYSFNYSEEDTATNSALLPTRYITVHCDNTFSVTKEEITTFVGYYKKMDETECGDLINYNVAD